MYYEDENNLYHYSYRKGDKNPNEPVEVKNYAEQPHSEPTPQKKRDRFSLKIVALALVCALVGGFAGAGLNHAGVLTRVNRTGVQISDREVAEVQTLKVSGKDQMSLAEVYAATVNSVVSINVSATSTNVYGQKVETAASGSGFIITPDGYIITNHHVVEGASSVTVTLYNGESYDAKVIGSDEEYDIAVIKIGETGLTPVVFGDSAKLNIGDTVAAIGNPLGELTFSMSAGVVSCVDRAINVGGTPFNMIQVDCSINPGNSGGPLMNTYGEVIGIVSAKYSSYSNTTVEGIGFAIPINDTLALVEDIMTNGYVSDKAYLGINPNTMTRQMAQQFRYDISEGVFICSVEPEGAADRAGLKMGDVIVKLGDKDIKSYEDLVAAKKSYRAGDTVEVTFYREGEYQTASITFDAAPQETEQSVPEQQAPQQNPGSYFDPWSWFFGNGFGW